MGTALIAAGTTLACALVSGLVAWATTRASAKGSVRAAQVSSLADLEREAGQRAAGIYQGAIQQLERERDEDRAEIADLQDQVDRLRAQTRATDRELVECRRACRALARKINYGEEDA